MKRFLLIALVGSLALIYACNGDEGEHPFEDDDPIVIELCDTLTPTYDGQVKQIFDMNCNIPDCHDATTMANEMTLNTYGNVKFEAQKERLAKAINHEPGYIAMPANAAKLDQSDIDIIECWISNGFQEN